MFAAARLCSIGALLLSAAAVAVFTQASIHNYPGMPQYRLGVQQLNTVWQCFTCTTCQLADGFASSVT